MTTVEFSTTGDEIVESAEQPLNRLLGYPQVEVEKYIQGLHPYNQLPDIPPPCETKGYYSWISDVIGNIIKMTKKSEVIDPPEYMSGFDTTVPTNTVDTTYPPEFISGFDPYQSPEDIKESGKMPTFYCYMKSGAYVVKDGVCKRLEPEFRDCGDYGKNSNMESTFYCKSKSQLWIKEVNGFLRSINIAS
jgi:hypothetical protein